MSRSIAGPVRWSLALAIACASTAAAQTFQPLPGRLTSVDARLYEPIQAPSEDAFGYPANDTDKTRLVHLLEASDHEGLETILRGLDRSTRDDIRNEFRLHSAYMAFDRTDAELGALLDAWVGARPRSVEARLARARYRLALAWEARGYDFLSATSAEQVAGMQHYRELAAEDAAVAVERDAGNLMTFDILFSVLMFEGWSDAHEQVLARSLERYPLSAVLREAALNAARPVWGGSWSRMESLATHAAVFTDRNPRLGVFGGYVDAERGRLALNEDDLPAAIHYYTRALEHGADRTFLLGRGKAWLAARDYTRALTDFVDAAYLMPQSPELLELRAMALFQIAQYAPPEIRDIVLDRAFEAALLLQEVDPGWEGVAALVDWIGQVRVGCRARSPQCRGRWKGSPVL